MQTFQEVLQQNEVETGFLGNWQSKVQQKHDETNDGKKKILKSENEDVTIFAMHKTLKSLFVSDIQRTTVCVYYR